MFRNLLSKYYKLQKAEQDFCDAIRSLPQTKCPYCGGQVTLNHIDDIFWMACTKCNLRTSNSKDLKVITYQWTQMSKLHQKPVQEICPEEDTLESNTTKDAFDEYIEF